MAPPLAVPLDGHLVVGVALGVDPVENRASRLEAQGGPVLAAARAKGLGETGPRQRRLVWRPDIAPKLRGLGAEPFRGRRLAGRKAHPPLSEGRAGQQRLALEPRGHPSQLVGGRSRSRDVAGRDLDLDLRLEQWRPLQIGVPAAPWTAPALDARARLGSTRPPWRRLPGPAARARDRAADPSRRDEQPGRRPRRRRCLPCEVVSAPARSWPSHLAPQVRAQLLAGGRASVSASPHDPRSRRISARWTRQRPRRLPMAFVVHHRSIASVHSSATSYCASPCRAHTSSQ